MAKIDTLKDNFNDNSFDAEKWDSFTGAASLSEENGVLKFDLTNAAPPSGSYAGIEGSSSYDLVGSGVLVEVLTTGVADSNAVSLACYDPVNGGGISLSEYSYNGLLTAEYNDTEYNYTDIASVTYNAVAHRWWRIRETGGTIYFDTSPNGIKWNNLGSVTKATVETAMGTSIGSLAVGVQANAVYLGTLTTTDAIIDNFNCPPRYLSLTGAGV